MPAMIHRFVLRATFGPVEVMKALRLVCEHPNQRDHAPDFGFDWIARKIELSSNSAAGTSECFNHFLGQVVKMGGPIEAFLPGKPTERDGRHAQPIGVALHDAATFGELIGKSLVEVGMRGVRVVDSAGECRIDVRQGALASSIDYATLVMEFPVPAYIKVTDEGTMPEGK